MTATTPEIKPIETEYAGHRFRSRLEARWAVAFDLLCLQWRYEAEGYDLDGVRYLPDFHLPVVAAGVGGGGCHVEVKGELDHDSLDKLVRLAGTVGPVLLVHDLPRSGTKGPHFILFRRARVLMGPDEVIAVRASLFQPVPGVLTVEPFGWPSLPLPVVSDHILLGNLHRWCLGDPDLSLFERQHVVDVQPVIAQAFDAARQARFEHGESGAPSLAFREDPPC